MDESISSTELDESGEPEKRIGSYRVLEPLGHRRDELGLPGGSRRDRPRGRPQGSDAFAGQELDLASAFPARGPQRRDARAPEHRRDLRSRDRLRVATTWCSNTSPAAIFTTTSSGKARSARPRRVSVVKSVAAGLKYAANRGLIHRDVKPSNILRTAERPDQDHRPRPGASERVRRRASHARGHDGRHRRLHGSRAGARQPGDQHSERHLFAGLHVLLPADRRSSVSRGATSPTSSRGTPRPRRRMFATCARTFPAEISAIILKLMAKRPEDRFASYDDLTTAINAVPLGGGSEAPGITLAPVSASAGDTYAGYGLDISQVHRNDGTHSNGSAEATIPLVALVELVGDDAPKASRERTVARQVSRDHAVLERRVSEPVAEPRSPMDDHTRLRSPPPRSGSSISITSWILPGVFLCGAMVVLGIGVLQFMASNDAGTRDAIGSDEQGGRALLNRPIASPPRDGVADGAMPGRQPPHDPAGKLTAGAAANPRCRRP